MLKEKYQQGMDRGLFTVEDAALDIHNRLLDIDIAQSKGELDDNSYQNQKKELADAAELFNEKVSDKYLSTDGIERDDKDRIISVDGTPVIPINLEELNESLKEYKKLMAKEKDAEFADLPYDYLYNAGIFMLRHFSVDQAYIDVLNRLINLNIASENGNIGDLYYKQENAKLENAKKFLASEMIKMYFFSGECETDSVGRFTKIGDREVKPIDIDAIC